VDAVSVPPDISSGIRAWSTRIRILVVIKVPSRRNRPPLDSPLAYLEAGADDVYEGPLDARFIQRCALLMWMIQQLPAERFPVPPSATW